LRKQLIKSRTVVLAAAAILFLASCQNAIDNDCVSVPKKIQNETVKHSPEDAIAWAIAYKNCRLCLSTL